MQDHQDLMNDFDWPGKTKQHSNLRAYLCGFGPKMKRILKIFKKILNKFLEIA